jgi:hypothetical protein
VNRTGRGVRVSDSLNPIDGMVRCRDVIAHRFANHSVVFNQQNSHGFSFQQSCNARRAAGSSEAWPGKMAPE